MNDLVLIIQTMSLVIATLAAMSKADAASNWPTQLGWVLIALAFAAVFAVLLVTAA